MKNNRCWFGSIAFVASLFAAGCAPESATNEDADPASDSSDASDASDSTAMLSSGCTQLTVGSIKASIVDGTNVAANAVDGNLATRWSGLGVGATLTADLGASKSVSCVDLAFYKGNTRKASFVVAVSADGATYTPVLTAQSSGTATSYEGYTFAPVTARYVRIIGNGTNESAWNSINELRLGGASAAPPPPPPPPPAGVLFSEPFSYPDGLITNEYANKHADGKKSAIWTVTSGSAFAKAGTMWTGIPDGTGPDADSKPYNDSAVFRMNTKKEFGGSVAVSFKLKNNYLTTTPRTSAESYDGVHMFIRHQSEYSMYYATINRRDNKTLVKKKVPGGPSNGGTYYSLGSTVSYAVPYGTWQDIKATVKNNSNGSVTIQIFANGKLLVNATDTGSGGPPITGPGKMGLRGDNCDFQADDFTVTSL